MKEFTVCSECLTKTMVCSLCHSALCNNRDCDSVGHLADQQVIKVTEELLENHSKMEILNVALLGELDPDE